MLANLSASGYSAEQVEEIDVTHMHTDHIGGLRDGQPVFPRAILRADVHEAGRYLSQAELDAAPADERGTTRARWRSSSPTSRPAGSSRSTAGPN